MTRSVQQFAVALMTLAAAAVATRATATEKLQYNRDIRPILVENCFTCHGADSAARKAGLRLDKRDDAIQHGAIVAGKPDESELIRRICSNSADESMPPKATKKVLSAAQKELLARWIREGAAYQPHWSFIPPARPATPAVKNAKWVRNPIDAFILSRLDAAGLEPAPESDRRTLARRVSFDLTGLPPFPASVEEFVKDTSPNAYETFVDKLLQSDRWGEHRGRYWLDYARYADTHGIHMDNYREIWTYRDWVINAFNKNMHFDQFTIESLAGDLLPNHTDEQLVGSGFNRCHITTNEGGAINEEYLVLYARDRTETTSRVWLGLTANCAVCHDHKFDPLSQREFYKLAAFFNNTTQGGMDGNVKDTPPTEVIPKAADRPRWAAIGPSLARARQEREARRTTARADFDKWAAAATVDSIGAAVPKSQLHLSAPLDRVHAGTTSLQVDGKERQVKLRPSAAWQAGPQSNRRALLTQGTAFEQADVGDFDTKQPFTCSAWVKIPANDSYGAICARMASPPQYRGWDMWSQQRRIGTHIINAWPDAALKVVAQTRVKANAWVHVAVTYDGSGKAAGVHVYYDGREQPTEIESDRLTGSIRTKVPFTVGQRSGGDPLSAGGISDLKIYKRVLGADEVDTLARSVRLSAIVQKTPKERTPAELDELFAWWIGSSDSRFRTLAAEVAHLEREQKEIKARGEIAYVMQERKEPATAYVLFRGDYDKRRDHVSADTPAALPPFPKDAPRNRLGFARWLLLPENPLTARVVVNRFWQEVFGTGIVRTSADFGIAGELPSHPELLDWLAVDFRESGWDVKRLFKLMVTSAAYRQSALATPEKIEKDPQNLLLARGPRFRMDAEMIRDAALAASGLLVEKIGGPSVKPYQPPGVWESIAMDVSNTKAYQRDMGENLYRRSLYSFWKRFAPPASMEIFNAPTREFCVVRRERTNTPLQALVTLNDEQFIEAARNLAEKAATEGGPSTAGRLKTISRRLLSRDLRPEESAVVCASLEKLQTYYRTHPDDVAKLLAVGDSKPASPLPRAELAAWTMVCNELMNLDEVLNK
jgi:mono/diheme cytochrome c family protein